MKPTQLQIETVQHQMNNLRLVIKNNLEGGKDNIKAVWCINRETGLGKFILVLAIESDGGSNLHAVAVFEHPNVIMTEYIPETSEMIDRKLVNPQAAVYISPDGGQDFIVPENEDGTLSLGQMQKIVGGDIEILKTKDGRSLVVNQDFDGLSHNPVASELYVNPDVVIVGTVIVCPPSMIS